ncbi:MAG: hypothetical protein ACJAZH_000515 [Roseivirga sp.]|jgi:hypothetical protein
METIELAFEIERKNTKRNMGIDVFRGVSILPVILLPLNIHFGTSGKLVKEM